MSNSHAWLQTWRGGILELPDFGIALGAHNEAIHHTETARVLSGIERWGARTRNRYTVAEHSVRVAWRVAELGGGVEAQWRAINHEGDEAVLGFDPASPLLAICPELRALKLRAHRAYCARYGMPEELPGVVKLADLELLMTERRDLMAPPPQRYSDELERIEPLSDVISPWSAEEAQHTFLMHWRELATQTGYCGEG